MKSAILKILQSSDKPIKRKDLLFHLRELGFQTTDREMRATIEEMIIKDEINIESGNMGYRLIKTEQELERAMKYLDAKAEAIAIRKNCLKRNWTKSVQKKTPQILQTELF